MVNPTIARLAAHCQNSTDSAVKTLPKINVDKQMKNDLFLPILKKKKFLFKRDQRKSEAFQL